MLAEAAGVSKIIIACGRTDLRKGIDGLAQLVGTKYDMNPFEKNVLFLFCGGRGDRIKGLLWEGNGFLLLYKRLEDGSFSWPRTPEEAMQLTREQYEMEGNTCNCVMTSSFRDSRGRRAKHVTQ